MRRRVFVVVFLLSVIGCDAADFSVLNNRIVVELTLVANEPVPVARVSELAPTDQPRDFADLAITNAQVILRTDGTDLLLEPIADQPGVYGYRANDHIVQPGVRYDIEVTVPGVANSITGMTNVPSSVEILTSSRESGVYLSDEQLVLKVSPGRGSDQSQSSFTLVTQAFDVRQESAVPTVSGFLENDDDLILEDFRISGSPIILEGNFVRFSDGTIELIYPWIGVSFYGPNIIYVNALDANLAGFIRSAELQQGGGDGTFGPGVIPNATQTLSGAHGLFGSVARDSVRFTVLPPE